VSIKSNPIARAIARNKKALVAGRFALAQTQGEAVAALMALADRINANSGSPTFTSDEHEALLQVIYRARGEA
jgi:hypothetical protein